MKLKDYFKKDVLALDTETTGLSWKNDKLVALSISDGKNFDAFMWNKISAADKKLLDKLLRDKNKIKIFHNAKFDIHFLMSAGFPIANNIWDTMLMAKVVNENLPTYKLKDLAASMVDKNAKKTQEILFAYLKKNSIEEFDSEKIPPNILLPYAAHDALFTYKLYEKFLPEVKKNFQKLWDMELELTPVIIAMERRGIAIDPEFFKKQSKKIKKDLKPIEKELIKELGNINFLSSPQVAAALDNMGIDVPKNKKGNPRLDRWTLDTIKHPIAKKLSKYRQMEHIASAFCDGLPTKADKKGILHCSFEQMGARTGRFSSRDPNLQNIPRDLGDIRRGFIARKGYTNFYLDYSQIEMRILIHYCEDPNMLKVMQEGGDLHQDTADRMKAAGLKMNTYSDADKSKDDRWLAKHTNFAVVYGMGAKGLSTDLNVTYDEAKRFLSLYYSVYPTIKNFRSLAERRIRERGYIFTTWGRYRRLGPEEAYKAANAVIQGSAADLMKSAMIRASKILQGTKSNLLVQVHDEIIIEIKNGEEYLIPEIMLAMEDYPIFNVPIKVDAALSKTSWADKKKIERDKVFKWRKKNGKRK